MITSYEWTLQDSPKKLRISNLTDEKNVDDRRQRIISVMEGANRSLEVVDDVDDNADDD
jgi:hypothetical protein